MITSYANILTIEPGKRGGKPCIRGMRVTVHDVLSDLAAGMTHENILAGFPCSTENDIGSRPAFAADRERQLVLVPA